KLEAVVAGERAREQAAVLDPGLAAGPESLEEREELVARRIEVIAPLPAPELGLGHADARRRRRDPVAEDMIDEQALDLHERLRRVGVVHEQDEADALVGQVDRRRPEAVDAAVVAEQARPLEVQAHVAQAVVRVAAAQEPGLAALGPLDAGARDDLAPAGAAARPPERDQL